MPFPPSDHLWVLFPDVFMVVTSEVAVDVIKHAFITKFNDITADVRTGPAVHPFIHQLHSAPNNPTGVEHISPRLVFQVYSEYRASLAFDLVSSRQKNVSNASLSL